MARSSWKLDKGTNTPSSALLLAGSALNRNGILYTTVFLNGTSSPFTGNVIKFDANGRFIGDFGSGYSGHPESLLFDSNNNVYVGSATGRSEGDADVRKFDSKGMPLSKYRCRYRSQGL